MGQRPGTIGKGEASSPTRGGDQRRASGFANSGEYAKRRARLLSALVAKPGGGSARSASFSSPTRTRTWNKSVNSLLAMFKSTGKSISCFARYMTMYLLKDERDDVKFARRKRNRSKGIC